MIPVEDILFYTIFGALLFMILAGLLVSIFLPWIDKWHKRFFIVYYLDQIANILLYLLEIFFTEKPEFYFALRVTLFWEYVCFSIPITMLTSYILHLLGEDLSGNTYFRLTIAFRCLFLALLGTNQFTGWFYSVTEDGVFHEAPLFGLLMVPHMLILLNSLILLVRERRRLPPIYVFTSFLFIFNAIPCMLSEIILSNTFYSYAGIIFCSFVIVIVTLWNQRSDFNQQQKKIVQQNANIMVLQMRPHFIYNTMMSIYYLCEQNPQKAQQVTLDFTTYLRKNFTAIASADLIPFLEELEHTLAYLAVEQAQYDDKLFFYLDTSYTNFLLPPLTLQPIVENSVKHGMDPDGGPLCIWIQTRRTNSGSEIIVEDNGAGFDPAHLPTSPTALTNIRQRLTIMCRGKLAIGQREGGGTMVCVTIPG